MLCLCSCAYQRGALQLFDLWFCCYSHFSFEVAIGINGAVWLRAANNSTVDAIVIRNAILQAEELDDAQLVALVEELVKRAKHVGRPAN